MSIAGLGKELTEGELRELEARFIEAQRTQKPLWLPPGEPMVKVRLVPVEVFGADEEVCPGCGMVIQFGYGLSDAVPAWSDCNRAIGHIYRVDDIEARGAEGLADCITIYVPQSEMAKFEKRIGDAFEDRCPSCHVKYDDLPASHRMSRPACTIAETMP